MKYEKNKLPVISKCIFTHELFDQPSCDDCELVACQHQQPDLGDPCFTNFDYTARQPNQMYNISIK